MAGLRCQIVARLHLFAGAFGAVRMLRPQNSGVSVRKCDTRFLSVFLRGAPQEAMAPGARGRRAGELVRASYWQGEVIRSTAAEMYAASAR